MTVSTCSDVQHAEPTAPIDVLVASHRRFLAFLEHKTGDRALAEDLLQAAFVRGLERIDQVRDDESVVAWFYRVLRNAIIDHHRKSATAARRLEALLEEPEAPSLPPDERESLCACLGELAQALPAADAQAIRRVDLDGVAVKDWATEAGITANHAGVRVFRARERLRRALTKCCGTCAQHGCSDCTCKAPAVGAES